MISYLKNYEKSAYVPGTDSPRAELKERNEEGMGEQERRDCSQSKTFQLC